MTEIDAITYEVIRNALLTGAAEMKVVVMRASYSTIWRESGDLSCAILSADADMIAQGPGDLPAHLATMPFSLRGALAKHPLETLEPGDVLFHNDPQWGNNHLPDCMMAKPIFADGKVLGFAVVRGHWTDIGGMGAGSYTAVTTDPLQEGLRIPPIKLYRRGEIEQSYVDMILANVRVPRDRMGDIRAQFAGCVIGERKLHALADKYGADTVRDCMSAILDHGEQLTRAELEQIPNGTYHYTDHSDGDGVVDETIKIQVALTIDGSDISVDFSGSHPQTIGGMNCPLAVTYSSGPVCHQGGGRPMEPGQQRLLSSGDGSCPGRECSESGDASFGGRRQSRDRHDHCLRNVWRALKSRSRALCRRRGRLLGGDRHRRGRQPGGASGSKICLPRDPGLFVGGQT